MNRDGSKPIKELLNELRWFELIKELLNEMFAQLANAVNAINSSNAFIDKLPRHVH